VRTQVSDRDATPAVDALLVVAFFHHEVRL
jgi:hypothetical protein